MSTRGGRPFCGGTLLSSDTVLTAAHCKTSVSSFNVVVGDHDVSRGDGEQRYRPRYRQHHRLLVLHLFPSQWISPPNYRGNDNDFAIIKLSSPVTISDTVLPACLPTSNKNYDGCKFISLLMMYKLSHDSQGCGHSHWMGNFVLWWKPAKHSSGGTIIINIGMKCK